MSGPQANASFVGISKKLGIKPIYLVALVIAGAGALYSAASKINRPTPLATSQPSNIRDPEAIVSVAQVAGGYASNELNADNLLKNKWIEMDGYVDRVALDVRNVPQIIFSSGVNGFVVAEMKQPVQSAVAGLEPGMHVSVRCYMRGKVVGMPFLQDCILAKIWGE